MGVLGVVEQVRRYADQFIVYVISLALGLTPAGGDTASPRPAGAAQPADRERLGESESLSRPAPWFWCDARRAGSCVP
jgi:hypothetical protein